MRRHDGVATADRIPPHPGALLGLLLVLAILSLASPAFGLEQELTAADGAAGDGLGWSVAIDGDTLVVGAPFDDASRGAVYVYGRSGGDWAQTAKLTASDGAPDDSLGYSVGIDGDTIVAGAPFDDIAANSDQGSAYTFVSTGGDRTQTAKLIASDGAAGDLLGEAVAIAADTIVVGARFDDVGAIGEEGSAYTFARGGAAVRTETSRLDAADGEAGDEFGFSVAVDADTILVGARRDTIGANANQGSASVFFSAGTDMTPPKTKGLKGPKKVERGERVRFRFKSTEPDSTFSCRLDRKKYKACRSPKRVRTSKLKPGGHSFSVFATDAAGNADPSPAKVRFKVVGGHRGK